MTRSLVASVTVALLLTTSLALARGKAPPALGETLVGDAKAAYNSGRLLFDDGDATGALTKFSHAYQVSGDARLLWNMAVCEKALRHYAAAASYIERYLEQGQELTQQQRDTATETLQALGAFYSRVALSGVPDGATVSVDGVNKGQSPLPSPLVLDLGAHHVRVEAEGFAPFETKVEVVGSTDLEVAVELKELPPPAPPPTAVVPGRLIVTTTGERDTVSIDGKVVGAHRWNGELAPGKHTLRVTGQDKKPYEAQVDLAPGGSKTLHVELESERNTTWYWVAGGAAVAAGVVGGFFLFRPDDSPGSHPTGSLSTVYLP